MTLTQTPFKDSLGNTLTLGDFSGKVILIVNTATKCGIAPQLAELETLHQKYSWVPWYFCRYEPVYSLIS